MMTLLPQQIFVVRADNSRGKRCKETPYPYFKGVQDNSLSGIHACAIFLPACLFDGLFVRSAGVSRFVCSFLRSVILIYACVSLV